MKHLIYISILTVACSSAVTGEVENTSNSNVQGDNAMELNESTLGPSLLDPRDDYNYQTVEIEGEEMMTENLRTRSFRNGDEIPLATSVSEWDALTSKGQPVCAYPNFDQSNLEQYGLLYNWYAMNDSRGLAPQGWHVATKDEFNWLVQWAGNSKYKGDLKSSASAFRSPDWPDNYNNRPANTLGFNGMPGGYIKEEKPWVDKPATIIMKKPGIAGGYWWTSTSHPSRETEAHYLYIKTHGPDDYSTEDIARVTTERKGSGMSVRCFKGSDGFGFNDVTTSTSSSEATTVTVTYAGQEFMGYCSVMFMTSSGEMLYFMDPSLGEFASSDCGIKDEYADETFTITYKPGLVEIYNEDCSCEESIERDVIVTIEIAK